MYYYQKKEQSKKGGGIFDSIINAASCDFSCCLCLSCLLGDV